MEMDNSFASSLNEIAALQRQQLQRMDDMATSQAQQTAMEKEKNLRDSAAYGSNVGYYGTPYNTSAPQYLPPGISANANILNAQMNNWKYYSGQLRNNNSKYGFTDSITDVDNSRISNETQYQLVQDYANRATNATLAGAGTVASAATSFAGYGIGSALSSNMLGSLFLGGAVGAAGGALVGSYFDNAIEQGKVQQAYTKYLMRESYRFINPTESKNDRGYTGFSLNESQDLANFLRTSNKEFYIKDEEMMKLLQKYTDSGLLRDVKDMETFKGKMKELTKSVKTGALILNETYESIADLMGEMKKVGIDSNNYSLYMSMGKLSGSALGMSGSEMIRTLLDTAKSQTAGTGLSTEHYMNRLNESTLYVNHLYEALKGDNSLSPKEQAALSYIRNNGGPEQVAGMVTSVQDYILDKYKNAAVAFYDYNYNTKSWDFNNSKFDQFTSGQRSAEDLMRFGEDSLNRYDDLVIKDWQDNYSVYLKNSLNQRQISKFSDQMARGLSLSMGGNYNDANVGLDLMLTDLSPDQRAMYEQYMATVESQGEGLVRYYQNMASMENLTSQIKSKQPSIKESMKYKWEGFKEDIGKVGSNLSNAFGRGFQSLNDKIYGKRFYDLHFETDMDWSRYGILKAEENLYGDFRDIHDNLLSLKSKGYNIDNNLLNLYDVKNTVPRTYKYARETFADGSKLQGIVGENYESISKFASKHDLSETILAALVKFSTRPEGKGLFGANKETIEEIAKNNSLNVQDPTRANTEQKLALASEYISKLMQAYGGNEGLAMKAFYSGQTSVDNELRRLGYDIDSLRKTGQQGELFNVDSNDVNVVNNNYTTYQGLKDSGYTSISPGVKYNVNGDPVAAEKLLQYDPTYDYLKGGKIKQNDDMFYDLIHYTADQAGVSPNALASVMGVESGGNSNALGASGDSGLMQIMPNMHYNKFIGKEVPLPSGQSMIIGESGLSMHEEMMDPAINLFMGANIFKDAINQADGNIALAYGIYNGGSGFFERQKEGAIQFGKDVYQLTPDEIYAIEDSMRPDLKISKHIKNFLDIYTSGAIVPTEKVVEDTSKDIEVEEIIKDAMTNKSVDVDNYEKMFGPAKSSAVVENIKKQAKGGAVKNINGLLNIIDKMPLSSEIKDSQKWWYKAADFTSGIFTGEHDSNIQKYSGYKDVIKAYENKGDLLYFYTPEDEDEIVKWMANSFNIHVGDNLTSKDREKVYREFSKKYNKHYSDIQNFVSGKSSYWGSQYSPTQKSEILKMMSVISQSNIGIDLGLKPVAEIVEGSFKNAFTKEELVEASKIGFEDNVYGKSSKDSYSKNANPVESFLKWAQKGAPINYDAIGISESSAEAILGKKMGDAQKDLAEQIRKVEMESRTAEKDITRYYTELESGDILKGFLTIQHKNQLLRAIDTGDYKAANQVRNEIFRTTKMMGGERDYQKELNELNGVIDAIKKSGGGEEGVKALKAQKDFLNKLTAQATDVAKASKVIGGMFLSKDEQEEFEEKFDYKLLSDKEKMMKTNVNEVMQKTQNASRTLLDEVSGMIKDNLDSFMETLESVNPFISEDFADKVNEILNETGGEITDNTAEKIAGVFIDMITESVDEAETEADKAKEAADKTKSAGEHYVEAMNSLSGSLENNVVDLNERVALLEAKTGKMQLPSFGDLFKIGRY